MEKLKFKFFSVLRWKIKTFFKNFSFLLPFHREPENHTWAIFFNGAWVGIYSGPDLVGLNIERWMESFPGDPNPIMIHCLYDFY